VVGGASVVTSVTSDVIVVPGEVGTFLDVEKWRHGDETLSWRGSTAKARLFVSN
jgi:hypothetical protein